MYHLGPCSSPHFCPGVGLQDHMVALLLIFKGNSILFSPVAIAMYIPALSVAIEQPHTSFSPLCSQNSRSRALMADTYPWASHQSFLESSSSFQLHDWHAFFFFFFSGDWAGNEIPQAWKTVKQSLIEIAFFFFPFLIWRKQKPKTLQLVEESLNNWLHLPF